ncbi:MAG: RnfABCDGE type electron transport complex subunit B [Cyclobacteriaceae bacterium]|jgi:electron transport complex protein RnfB|nr:RnfABCDGE type electron transport complex subunit B [Flammeovirgaceae bacterium]MCZ8069134.1 RnfABCDGE type electron transport complex subunit B [Cytophagales bacterium]
MNDVVLYTVLSLTGIGLLAAVVLYYVSKKFHVTEDERIARVEAVLPNTNCGGCGQPGCHAFAEAVVKSGDLSVLHCPVGGNPVMKQVAEVLGVKTVEKDPYIAVVRCSGSFEYRKKTNVYDGAPSCAIAAQLYSGDTGCAYGCLGMGDCVVACDFEAMYMDEKTGLPVIIEDKCTACNACVKSCPKDILELWPKGKKNQRIYVACLNEEKGSTARKECAVACSGCAKCAEACRYEAITIDHNLAAIDPDKCKLCAECIDTCDVRNIIATNFSPEKLLQASEHRQKREERERKKREEEKAKAATAATNPETPA